MINKWLRNDLKKLQKENLIETLKNDLVNGPHYALKLYKIIDLPIEFEEKIFNIISLGSKASYSYFENEKDKSVKKLTPERRSLLFKSVSQDLYALGNFIRSYATAKEIAMIIKDLQPQKHYIQNDKRSYDHLICSIWERCISITGFPHKRLLMDNGKVIFNFLSNYYRKFTSDEIKYIYNLHHDLIFKQNKRNCDNLILYCKIFLNFITFEKDLIIDLIIKENDINHAMWYLNYNEFNFNQEQREKLESLIILNKLTGG